MSGGGGVMCVVAPWQVRDIEAQIEATGLLQTGITHGYSLGTFVNQM